MSTAKKKTLLERIANMTDGEARDALNTLTMNLNASKKTVVRDLEDALANSTPDRCTAHGTTKNKRSDKKGTLKTKKKNRKTKAIGADDDNSDHEPTNLKPEHKNIDKKGPEISIGDPMMVDNCENEPPSSRHKKKSKKSKNRTNSDQSEACPEAVSKKSFSSQKAKHNERQAPVQESNAGAVLAIETTQTRHLDGQTHGQNPPQQRHIGQTSQQKSAAKQQSRKKCYQGRFNRQQNLRPKDAQRQSNQRQNQQHQSTQRQNAQSPNNQRQQHHPQNHQPDHAESPSRCQNTSGQKRQSHNMEPETPCRPSKKARGLQNEGIQGQDTANRVCQPSLVPKRPETSSMNASIAHKVARSTTVPLRQIPTWVPAPQRDSHSPRPSSRNENLHIKNEQDLEDDVQVLSDTPAIFKRDPLERNVQPIAPADHTGRVQAAHTTRVSIIVLKNT